MNITKLGESGLIDIIRKKVKNKDKTIKVGIGDDCAIIKLGDQLVALTTDTLIENAHFSLDYFDPEQIGKKAIEVNVSDIASVGAIPKYALVSLSLRKDLTTKTFKKIYSGILKAAKKYNISVIGGNLTHAEQISVTISLIGFVQKENLCLRSDAKPGDFILTTGVLGDSAAGLDLLLNKVKGFKDIKKKHLEPKSSIHKVNRFLQYINAMEDISDGLAKELKNICKESKVGAIIFKDKIPIRKETIQAAKIMYKNPLDYALYGGEDFELVFTVSRENLIKVKGILIGRIRKKKGIYIYDNKQEKLISKKGYDHF